MPVSLGLGARVPPAATPPLSPGWAVPQFPPTVLHSTCSDFSHGTALHIAASNLCLGAVRCLLEHGADPALRVPRGLGGASGGWGGIGVTGRDWGFGGVMVY